MPPAAPAMMSTVMQSVITRAVMPAMAPATAQAAVWEMTPAVERANAPTLE